MGNLKIENFTKVKGYRNFIQGAHKVLINTLSDFFSAEVDINFEPLNGIKKVQGNIIRDNIFRNVYVLDKNTILLICSIHVEDIVYVLGIILAATNLGDRKSRRIFNIVAAYDMCCWSICI